jgi:fructose-1,6-bisphosphatase/inositol monophosphatase family enzyme
LNDATLYSAIFERYDKQALPRYQNLLKHCKLRICTSDCLPLGLLASSFTDIVLETNLEPYDYIASVPVIEGAGGVITDWLGHPITLNTGDKILATANIKLHKKALACLL